jgi:hypothetical protein
MPRQNQGKEYSQIFKVGSAFRLMQTPEQTSTPILTQGVWQTPLQGQQQTPIQEQAQIQRQQQITKIRTPPQLTPQIYERTPTPLIGIPGLPVIPDFGGPVGPGTKRRPRRFTEIFPIGLYDSAMAAMGGKRLPKGKAKKGRIIPAKRAKKK